MRSYLRAFDLVTPATFDEALERLRAEPGEWRPFAGGTDLMVLLEAGKLPPGRYLSLWGLEELRGIHVSPEAVTIGALSTYAEIRRHETLEAECPLLCRAAAETGGLANQNRGTIGGNIANGSPAADSPPALLVYDAALELVSAGGSRWVDYAAFHTGYKTMDLRPDELIARIRITRGRRGWNQYYRKVGTRRAQAISKVCLAAAADVRSGTIDDLRVAIGSVAPAVVRCRGTEDLLRGSRVTDEIVHAAGERLAHEIAPIDDIRSTARYRLRAARNLLEEFLYGCV